MALIDEGNLGSSRFSSSLVLFPLARLFQPPYTTPHADGGNVIWTSGGAIAQLVERLNGIQEVRGSTPLGSTKSI